MAKILITDDSEFIRTIMKSMLAEAGYKDVIEAKDGKDAISKYKAEKPDLVLLDIIMPDMDGVQFLEQIQPVSSKICMVSAVGQKDMIDRAKSLGAVDYITKPFEKEKVIETVKKLLS